MKLPQIWVPEDLQFESADDCLSERPHDGAAVLLTDFHAADQLLEQATALASALEFYAYGDDTKVDQIKEEVDVSGEARAFGWQARVALASWTAFREGKIK